MIEVVYRELEGEWKTSPSWDDFRDQFRDRDLPPKLKPINCTPNVPADDVFKATGQKVDSPWWTYQVIEFTKRRGRTVKVECYWK